MFKRLITKCVTGLVLLFAVSHCQAQQAPNEYASWKGCKVGTMVKFQATDSAHPGYVGYFTTKLVKIEGDQFFVEQTTYEPGQEPKVHRVSPPAAHAATTKASTQLIAESDEQLDVAGHKVKAHVTKTSSNGKVTTTAVSDQIPGGYCSIVEVTKEDGVQHVFTFNAIEITRP